jgi:hypothetical protein
MAQKDKMAGHPNARPVAGGRKPEWAQGLKKLYDSVVEEPLPDDLAALLARFDEEGTK